jgi:hypothetical protein
MSLLIIENFYDWPSSAPFSPENISAENSVARTTGTVHRAGTASLELNSYNDYLSFPLTGSHSTLRFCLRIRKNLQSYPLALVSFRSSSGTQMNIGISSTGYLYAAMSESISPPGGWTATTDSIPQDTWTYIEGRVVIHASTGAVELRVNGSETPALSLSGVDTEYYAGQLVTSVCLGEFNGNDSFRGYVTDFCVWTEDGEAPTGWIGECQVDTLLPTGAGSSTDFTASAGSNYQCVDEVPNNLGTDYVESSTDGDVDLYAMADLAEEPATIHAVAVAVSAAKTDAGSGSIKSVMKSGATTAESGARALSNGAYLRNVYARGVDPNTSSAWTASAVNALEAGCKAVI